MARGRKPKNKLPESPTVQALVEKITEVGENAGVLEQKPTEFEWDVKIGDPIDYFDSNLSYELTGYRPINDTQGLDFNPD